MSRGLVLVIEDDEWLSRLLQSAIREAGYDVVLCATARVGLDAAIDQPPECIVCDVDLPDSDGYWVARNVRTHPSRVSVTPFLFLSGLDDEASRLEGFHVGADVYMTKPFRTDEVVAQIGALVQMATRLRARRDSMLSLPPGAPHERASRATSGRCPSRPCSRCSRWSGAPGTFEVVSKKRRAQLEHRRRRRDGGDGRRHRRDGARRAPHHARVEGRPLLVHARPRAGQPDRGRQQDARRVPHRGDAARGRGRRATSSSCRPRATRSGSRRGSPPRRSAALPRPRPTSRPPPRARRGRWSSRGCSTPSSPTGRSRPRSRRPTRAPPPCARRSARRCCRRPSRRCPPSTRRAPRRRRGLRRRWRRSAERPAREDHVGGAGILPAGRRRSMRLAVKGVAGRPVPGRRTYIPVTIRYSSWYGTSSSRLSSTLRRHSSPFDPGMR